MNKKGVFVFALMLIAFFTKAQTIDDAKKMMYYERWKSAKETLDKLIAANTNNLEAVYYLGQVMLRRDENVDIAGAKKLYQTALGASSANGNNPLLIAGMGHAELMEGKTNDARNRFETALSLSQNKNIQVINAVGIANITNDNGDALYAIDKLKLATQIKGFKDAELMTTLGDAYAKALDGGNAERSYETALTYNPSYARAKYRIGKIYQRQNQPDLFFPRYQEAINMDSKFTPVYLTLYDIYSKLDLVKAEENLNKYLDNTDPDPKNCYLRAKMKYEQKDFNAAIAKSTECINAGGDVYFKNYGIIAYANYRLNECQKSLEAFKQYFAKAKPENIGAGDYEVYADLLLKCNNDAANAGVYYEKALATDTVVKAKPAYLKKMTAYYDEQKQYTNAAIWYKKLLAFIPNPTRTDLFNVAYNYHRGGMYQDAIDNWKVYQEKYPKEENGYYLSALSSGKIDTSMKLGLAVPNYIKALDAGDLQWATDSATVKAHYLSACKYLISYYYNAKKDPKTAIIYCDKYLSKEPGDAEVQNYRKAFATMKSAPPAPPVKPATTKPSTTPRTVPAPKPIAKVPVKKKA